MSIRSHRLALGAAAALLASAVVSGCGVSDEQLRPGVAAAVGDSEVSLETIDEAIDTACAYFVDQEQVGFPRSLARQQFVSVLVQRAAAEQALAEQGLEIGDDYQQSVSSLDEANAQIPEDQRAPFELLSEATTYVDAASLVLGEAALGAEGEAATDPALVTERGRAEIASWIAGNDVAINPAFRLTVDEGQVVSDAGGTSVATSDLAVATLLDPATASTEQVDASAAQLPPGQLCGVPAA